MSVEEPHFQRQPVKMTLRPHAQNVIMLFSAVKDFINFQRTLILIVIILTTIHTWLTSWFPWQCAETDVWHLPHWEEASLLGIWFMFFPNPNFIYITCFPVHRLKNNNHYIPLLKYSLNKSNLFMLCVSSVSILCYFF